jgi:hypothetical protein
MDLATLLLKVLYLFVLYVICFFILRSQTPLNGGNLYVISILISVLLMYFTFDYVYSFLQGSELILKRTNDTTINNNDDQNMNRNRNRLEVDQSTKVQNKSINDYVFDHTHKFISDKIFQS